MFTSLVLLVALLPFLAVAEAFALCLFFDAFVDF